MRDKDLPLINGKPFGAFGDNVLIKIIDEDIQDDYDVDNERDKPTIAKVIHCNDDVSYNKDLDVGDLIAFKYYESVPLKDKYVLINVESIIGKEFK